MPPSHRAAGYVLLRGSGLEIGAFHEPAALPPGCAVKYFDVMDAAAAKRWFPEIDASRLVAVDHFGDLDQDGLAQFAAGQFDFVIISHVLEHVANPIKAVREVFRITRTGGIVVIAVPDKEYTFDRERPLTSFDHLWNDYLQDIRESPDEHYLDFLQFVGPHVFAEPPENLPGHLQWVRQRHEHVHVWNTSTCRAFLRESMDRLALDTILRQESPGSENGIEYFSVWEKG